MLLNGMIADIFRGKMNYRKNYNKNEKGRSFFILIDVSFFKPLFEIKSYMCAGVEGLISKVHLVALEEGKMINS